MDVEKPTFEKHAHYWHFIRITKKKWHINHAKKLIQAKLVHLRTVSSDEDRKA
jgi:hypothetical protein